MRYIFIIIICSVLFSCRDQKSDAEEKNKVLTADREAPRGWVYLELYKDQSFKLRFGRRRKPKSGNYNYSNDTLFFTYTSDIDPIRSKAVIKENIVCFLNDSVQSLTKRDCSDFVEIRMNILKEKK